MTSAIGLHYKYKNLLALSNRSGKYLNVITDWWYLCYPCHGRYDAVGLKVWEVRKELYGQKGRA